MVTFIWTGSVYLHVISWQSGPVIFDSFLSVAGSGPALNSWYMFNALRGRCAGYILFRCIHNIYWLCIHNFISTLQMPKYIFQNSKWCENCTLSVFMDMFSVLITLNDFMGIGECVANFGPLENSATEWIGTVMAREHRYRAENLAN